MAKRAIIMLICCLSAHVGMSQTVHNIQRVSEEFGFKYFFGIYYETSGPPNVTTISGATGGDSVSIRDRALWSVDQGFSFALDNEIRFVFRGSGLEVDAIAWDQNEPLFYEIVGTTQGQRLFTAPPGAPFIQRLVIAPQGTLDPNKLQLLRLWTIDTSGEFILQKGCFLDTIRVYDEQPITRIEDNSPFITTVGGDWAPVTGGPQNDFYATQGSLLQSNTTSDSLTFTFNGTALAINGGGHYAATGKYNWDLDNGAQTGTIDQSLDGNWGFCWRWPDVVLNNLAPGTHTIKMTVAGEGQYQGTGLYLDAFDIIPSAPTVPAAARNWTLY